MVIYIIGAILFFIVLLLWKNSYYKRKPIHEIEEEYERHGHKYIKEGKFLRYEYYDKIESPLWLFLLLIVAFLIPILNIVIPTYIIIRMVCDCGEGSYIHFNESSLWGKVWRFFREIGKFLNKDVF